MSTEQDAQFMPDYRADKFVHSFPFYFNWETSEKINKPVAVKRMLQLLNEHPSLGPYIFEFSQEFSKCFPEADPCQLGCEQEVLDWYAGLHLDNNSVPQLNQFYLVARTDCAEANYASSGGTNFDTWMSKNEFRRPVGLHVDVTVR